VELGDIARAALCTRKPHGKAKLQDCLSSALGIELRVLGHAPRTRIAMQRPATRASPKGATSSVPDSLCGAARSGENAAHWPPMPAAAPTSHALSCHGMEDLSADVARSNLDTNAGNSLQPCGSPSVFACSRRFSPAGGKEETKRGESTRGDACFLVGDASRAQSTRSPSSRRVRAGRPRTHRNWGRITRLCSLRWSGCRLEASMAGVPLPEYAPHPRGETRPADSLGVYYSRQNGYTLMSRSWGLRRTDVGSAAHSPVAQQGVNDAQATSPTPKACRGGAATRNHLHGPLYTQGCDKGLVMRLLLPRRYV
jgi:hypothetical protein